MLGRQQLFSILEKVTLDTTANNKAYQKFQFGKKLKYFMHIIFGIL